MEIWVCEQVRVTLFYASRIDVKSGPSIEEIFGKEADGIEIKAAESFRGETVSLGPGTAQLVARLNRVDCIWQAPAEAVNSGKGLGLAKDVIVEFMAHVGKWIKRQDSVIRIALGGTFAQKVASRAEGYGALQKYLRRVQVDTSGSQDFLYQINYPIKAHVSDRELAVNRISRWMVRQILQGAFQISIGAPGPVDSVTTEVVAELATIELDVNSDAINQSPLNAADSNKLLDLFQAEILGILSGQSYA